MATSRPSLSSLEGSGAAAVAGPTMVDSNGWISTEVPTVAALLERVDKLSRTIDRAAAAHASAPLKLIRPHSAAPQMSIHRVAPPGDSPRRPVVALPTLPADWVSTGLPPMNPRRAAAIVHASQRAQCIAPVLPVLGGSGRAPLPPREQHSTSRRPASASSSLQRTSIRSRGNDGDGSGLGLPVMIRVSARALRVAQALQDNGIDAAQALRLVDQAQGRRPQSARTRDAPLHRSAPDFQQQALLREQRFQAAARRAASAQEEATSRAIAWQFKNARARQRRLRTDDLAGLLVDMVVVRAYQSIVRSITTAREHILLEQRRGLAAIKLQAWGRALLAQWRTRRMSRSLRVLRWWLTRFALQWRERRQSHAVKVIMSFLGLAQGLSRQRRLILQFRKGAWAARIVVSRIRVVLLQRRAQAEVIAKQLELTERRLVYEHVARQLGPILELSEGRVAAMLTTILRRKHGHFGIARSRSQSSGRSSRLQSGESGDDDEDEDDKGDNGEIFNDRHGGRANRSTKRQAASSAEVLVGTSGSVLDTFAARLEPMAEAVPVVPLTHRANEAQRLLSYFRCEHRDLRWRHRQVVQKLEPFLERKRRESEIAQRIHHVGPMSEFVFEESLANLSALVPTPPRLCLLLPEEELLRAVRRMRLSMARLVPRGDWVLRRMREESV